MTQYSLSGVIRVNFLKMSMFLIVKHHKWPITDKYMIKNQVREVWKIALKLDWPAEIDCWKGKRLKNVLTCRSQTEKKNPLSAEVKK